MQHLNFPIDVRIFHACLLSAFSLMIRLKNGRRKIVNQSKTQNPVDLESCLESTESDLKEANKALRKEVAKSKKLEKALLESEERYRAIVEMQAELICRYLPDCTLTFVNEAYCRYFGKTREELIGESLLNLIPEKDWDATKLHIRHICESPQPLVYEHPVIAAGGEIRWHQWVDQVILNPDGSIRECQAVGRDITEIKRAEEVRLRKFDQLNGFRERYDRLTAREREVMGFVVTGAMNKEIAEKIGTTERTVKFHRHQIMEKMKLGSLAELVRIAEKLEDIKPQS